MNDRARRMIMDRQRRRRDYEMMGDRNSMDNYDRRAMDYARRAIDYIRRDYRLSDPLGTEPEYPQEMMWDGKQGVKGTGPYGIGGNMYYRGNDYGYDDRVVDSARRGMDYGYEEEDGHHPSGLMHLKKKDFSEWEKGLENADGSRGKHFDMEQIKRSAEQIGIKYRDYDEKELCMTANMLYSDFCEVLKSVIPPEKEVMAYVKLAKAWLEDPDSPVDGSEKLALYYWCIVKDEE